MTFYFWVVRRQTSVQAQPEADIRGGPEREHGNCVRGGCISGTGRFQVDFQSDWWRGIRNRQQ